MIKKLLVFYNLLVTLILAVFSFTSVTSNKDLIFPILISPLLLYFFKALFQPLPKKRVARSQSTNLALSPSKVTKKGISPDSTVDGEVLDPEILNETQVRDIDRRLFLKLIGSAGLTTFIFSLFTDKAHGAFFGSMPGPGVIGLKDSAGNLIDPAEKLPTDGYRIAQLDDTSSPDYAYYGFVDKDANWYLQRETLSGANTGQYLYSRGSSGFVTAWTNRVSPTPAYSTFDVIF